MSFMRFLEGGQGGDNQGAKKSLAIDEIEETSSIYRETVITCSRKLPSQLGVTKAQRAER